MGGAQGLTYWRTLSCREEALQVRAPLAMVGQGVRQRAHRIASKGVSPPIPTPTQYSDLLSAAALLPPAAPQRRPRPPTGPSTRGPPSQVRAPAPPAEARSSPQSCRIFGLGLCTRPPPFWLPPPLRRILVASPGPRCTRAAARPAPPFRATRVWGRRSRSASHTPHLYRPRHRGTSSLGLSRFLCLRCYRPHSPHSRGLPLSAESPSVHDQANTGFAPHSLAPRLFQGKNRVRLLCL